MLPASAPFGINTAALRPIISSLESRPVRYPTVAFFCLLHQKLVGAVNPTIENKGTSQDFIWGTPGDMRSAAQVKSVSARGIRPELIPGEMQLLTDQLTAHEWRGSNYTPVHKAAFLMARMHSIAPFGDANSRVSGLTAGSMLIADHQSTFMFKFTAPASVPQALGFAIERNDLGPLSRLIHMSIRPTETRPGGKIISPFRVNAVDASEVFAASRLPATALPKPPPGHGFPEKTEPALRPAEDRPGI
jgi:hypothetical protein